MLKHSANTYNSPNKPTDRLIREDERRTLTSISRSQAWLLEKKGSFREESDLVIALLLGVYLRFWSGSKHEKEFNNENDSLLRLQ